MISDHLRRDTEEAFIVTDDDEWDLRLCCPGVSQPYVSICLLMESVIAVCPRVESCSVGASVSLEVSNLLITGF